MLAGPLQLTSGNTLSDIHIRSSQEVAVNATGTFTFEGCRISDIGTNALYAPADSTSLHWSVLDCTFTNTTGSAVTVNITDSAAQNLTVANCTSSGGRTKSRGLSVSLSRATDFLGLVSGNNITGNQLDGIFVEAGETARARVRFTNNRTLGNLLNRDLVVQQAFGSPEMGCIFNGNTSDVFDLFNLTPAKFQVEELAQFNTTSANTGRLTRSSSVTSVTAGTLGIP